MFSLRLNRIFSFFKSYDWLLFLSVLLLLSFGLTALYGIATSFDEPNFLNFKKQIIFSLVGLILLLVIGMLDYLNFQEYAFPLYGIGGILLLAVLFFGKTSGGTTGWFDMFGFRFQPIEFAKVALIIYLARYLSHHENSSELRVMTVTCIGTLIFFALTIRQPDFGSAIILIFIWLAMLTVYGIRKRYFFGLLGFLIVSFLLSWFFLFQDYQKDRFLSFLNPQSDPYGRGYHVRQAIIAVGSGKLFGRGLGSGSQSQLKFIPASQTDFIYAVIAEELGLIGAGLVVALFTLFFYRLFRLGRNAHDSFSFFVIVGISALFYSHFFINVGMNVGLLPVTGIGLPFISYGGSFLIISLLLVGMLQAIARRSHSI